MKIVVGSTNIVKINAAKDAFLLAFPGVSCEVVGVAAPSGVSDQPVTDEETLRGAMHRASRARDAMPHADFWVGMEGGVLDSALGMECFAWIAVQGIDRVGTARTGTFLLPTEIARLIRGGMELGLADDRVFGRSNSKQQNGSVGILTNDIITRTDYYVHATVLALIPFIQKDLYV